MTGGNQIVYIHYGHDKFETPKPINNREAWIKPQGGLWASRKGDPYGWINWCESEGFRLNRLNKYFEFMLNENAKILTLNHIDQLDRLPLVNPPEHPYIKGKPCSFCYLDFDKLATEYDAIELTNISAFYWALYGWDCNCILVMNPQIINLL